MSGTTSTTTGTVDTVTVATIPIDVLAQRVAGYLPRSQGGNTTITGPALLGNPSTNGAAASAIAIGANLSMTSDGTLSATGSAAAGTQGPIGQTGNGIASMAIGSGALLVNYTNGTTVNLGQVVGPTGATGRGISNMLIDSSGHLQLTYTDATTPLDLGLVVGAPGNNGTRGVAGAAGVGISSVAIGNSGASTGHLLITNTNSITTDVGQVVGATGAVGNGISSASIPTSGTASGHLLLNYTNGTTADVGLVVGAAGASVTAATISSGNLFLTYGGTQSNLGSVVGPAGTGLTNRGTWVSGTTYNPNDYTFASDGKGGTGLFALIGTSYSSTTQPNVDTSHWSALTAPQGATGRGITSATIASGGTTSGHLQIVYSDSTIATDLGLVVGANGTNGATGAVGKGITSTSITGDGHLHVYYSDASNVDVGQVVGAAGAAGVGFSSASIGTAGTQTGHLLLTNTLGTVWDVGQVVGAAGPTGPTGVGISSVLIGTTGSTIGHLMVTNTAGTTSDAGLVVGANGSPGTPGVPGVGVSSASVTGGNLIMTLTNAATINAGGVVGPSGPAGTYSLSSATLLGQAAGKSGAPTQIAIGGSLSISSTGTLSSTGVATTIGSGTDISSTVVQPTGGTNSAALNAAISAGYVDPAFFSASGMGVYAAAGATSGGGADAVAAFTAALAFASGFPALTVRITGNLILNPTVATTFTVASGTVLQVGQGTITIAGTQAVTFAIQLGAQIAGPAVPFFVYGNMNSLLNPNVTFAGNLKNVVAYAEWFGAVKDGFFANGNGSSNNCYPPWSDTLTTTYFGLTIGANVVAPFVRTTVGSATFTLQGTKLAAPKVGQVINVPGAGPNNWAGPTGYVAWSSTTAGANLPLTGKITAVVKNNTPTSWQNPTYGSAAGIQEYQVTIGPVGAEAAPVASVTLPNPAAYAGIGNGTGGVGNSNGLAGVTPVPASAPLGFPTYMSWGTDNTPAINAALSLKCPVLLLPGSYGILGPVTVGTGGVLMGSGSGLTFLVGLGCLANNTGAPVSGTITNTISCYIDVSNASSGSNAFCYVGGFRFNAPQPWGGTMASTDTSMPTNGANVPGAQIGAGSLQPSDFMQLPPIICASGSQGSSGVNVRDVVIGSGAWTGLYFPSGSGKINISDVVVQAFGTAGEFYQGTDDYFIRNFKAWKMDADWLQTNYQNSKYTTGLIFGRGVYKISNGAFGVGTSIKCIGDPVTGTKNYNKNPFVHVVGVHFDVAAGIYMNSPGGVVTVTSCEGGFGNPNFTNDQFSKITCASGSVILNGFNMSTTADWGAGGAGSTILPLMSITGGSVIWKGGITFNNQTTNPPDLSLIKISGTSYVDLDFAFTRPAAGAAYLNPIVSVTGTGVTGSIAVKAVAGVLPTRFGCPSPLGTGTRQGVLINVANDTPLFLDGSNAPGWTALLPTTPVNLAVGSNNMLIQNVN
jgi:hypothetical protein